MPVRKFRSINEMPAPEPRPPLDPENLRIAFAWMKLAIELHPEPLQPGVRKLSTPASPHTRAPLRSGSATERSP